ncbi:MAG: GIY-YIG nuclease family protein [Patescibacteria group bacterium]|jgi:excinuclease ABC subunit C|nr:GIY-YIG nuclease family protein [Patescibacteria group bacterium]
MSSVSVKIKEKIKKSPKSPGVYFWLEKNKNILYVGRAVNLRNRLKNYLQKNIDSRIYEMVNLAVDIDYIETDSLLEAIIKEAYYIKKYWPKYNVKDRDGRSFIYLVISKDEYPKPIIVRGTDLNKFKVKNEDIFGPFQSYKLLRSSLDLLRKIFPYSTCQSNSGKPCFDYQIGLCPGTCISKISKVDYMKNIRSLKMIFAGEKKRLMKKLIKDNPEKAKALKHLQDVSLLSKEDDLAMTKLNRIECYDISHHAGKEAYGSMVVFENGEANNSEYRLFKIKEAPEGDDERALEEVLTRRFKHVEWTFPDLIVIDGGLPQISFLNKKFLGSKYPPIIGISKLGGDRLVYPHGFSKDLKDLASNLKPTLLKAREEAHRFANYGRLKGSKIK